MNRTEFLRAFDFEIEKRFQIIRKQMPYRTGNLAYNAYYKKPNGVGKYDIGIDLSIAPYAEYLETGYGPYDIPGAFGRKPPFGIGGRYDGHFHPGSYKHKGFWEDAMRDFMLGMAGEFNGTITSGPPGSRISSIAESHFADGGEGS